MPANLRYTAASSSRITKPSTRTSPIKQGRDILRNKSPFTSKNLLSSFKDKSGSKENQKIEGPLEVQDYNVQLDYQLSKREDLLVAIDLILDNQWSEATTLHSRYHTPYEIERASNEDELLLLLRGLSLKTKAEILQYRKQQFPGGIVTVNQLYSMYEHQGHTFVDKSLEIKTRLGMVKKFVITNASPVILRSPQKFQHGKVTYGYENVEVVVKLETYFHLIDECIANKEMESGGPETSESDQAFKLLIVTSLKKFRRFVSSNPTCLFVSACDDQFDQKSVSELVKLGFLTLTSNHMNEIESQYAVSYPGCGTYLKLINAGRTWLVKTLNKCYHKEILEEKLLYKWEGYSASFAGESKMLNFRKPFYGYDLFWILADTLGAGIVEVFNTPVGRGWRLTGKV